MHDWIAGFRHGAFSGGAYSLAAFLVPDSWIGLGEKLLLALPLGLLTGAGTALGSVLVKKLMIKKEKKNV